MELDRITRRHVPCMRSASLVARSRVASRGTSRAGCLGHPWPASFGGALRTYTLGIPASRLRPPTCVRVQVHQLSRASAAAARLCSRSFALRPSYTMRCFAQWLRHCSLARDRPARTVAPGSLAAKPALCKMAAAASWESAPLRAGGVRRFGQVLAARLQARALALT